MQAQAFRFPQSILSNHVALIGKTGSGKTSTGKLFIEQVVDDGARVCILDSVKSDWWGLISSSDGTKPGLPFQILGGPRGHVPLHAGAGDALGKLVGTGALRLSIIDMADFEPGGLQKFFNAFTPSLLKHQRGVLYLVMEEAHEFAPKERAGIGAETVAIHFAKKLATAGRSKGIRIVVLTQSVQQLHNRVLGSCETMIAHRLTTPADQKPVIEWLKAHAGKEITDTIAQQLANLKTGTGWMVSPEGAEQIHFPKYRTYDNTATPEHDGEFDEVIKTAPVDTDKLREILGEAVKEAEENDPKVLKARIADLERKAPATAPSAQEISIARGNGYREGFEAGRLQGRQDVAFALTNVRIAVDEAAGAVAEAKSLLDGMKFPPVSAVQNRIDADGLDRIPAHAVQTSRAVDQHAGEKKAKEILLPAGEFRVLTAIAQHRDGVTREQLTVLTGYKKSSRDTYLQRLAQNGHITIHGGVITALKSGIAALGPAFRPLPTGQALRELYMAPGTLPEGERRILKLLLDAYPKPLERDRISELTHYKKSSRDTYVQKLAARQLVTVDRHGVRASNNLFS